MSGEGMPKRNRADTPNQTPARSAEVVEVIDSPPTTQTVTVEEVMETTPDQAERDPFLEQQLDALDVEEGFRESIRAMTPNTRRDVLNDIIRFQQNRGAEAELHNLGVPSGLSGHIFTFSMGGPAEDSNEHSDAHEWIDEAEGEEEEEVGEGSDDAESVDLGDDMHQRGGQGFVRQPPRIFTFGGRGMNMDEVGEYTHVPRVPTFRDQAGGPEMALDFVDSLLLRHIGRAVQGGRQSEAQQRQGLEAMEERMMVLRNLISMLHQARSMQSMGLDRDIDDMSYEELLELEERIGNVSKGVPLALLESCMTRVGISASDETCPICQEELHATASAGGDEAPATGEDKICVKLLNCPHMFHKPCIKQWLASNKTCPVCKQEVLPKTETTST